MRGQGPKRPGDAELQPQAVASPRALIPLTVAHPSASSLTLHDENTEEEGVPLIQLPNRCSLVSYSQTLNADHTSASTGAIACICTSHLLARWAWRTWEFAVALILMQLYPSSLLWVSAYGLLDDLSRLLLGPFIGQYIDRTDRLKGAITCYGVQNICIAVSAGSSVLLMWLQHSKQNVLTDAVQRLLLSLTLVAGAFCSVGSLGAAVAVEREYPAVMCGCDSHRLSKINTGMRAIDLLCQMLAPMAAGFLMTYASMLAAIAMLACYCLAVWLPECLLLHTAASWCPALRQPRSRQPCTGPSKSHPLSVLLGCSGWHTYLTQSTLLAGVALALLYLTVLSLGFLMTSYLVWRGLSEATLSLFRAAGAISGLAATLVFHPVQRYAGLPATGCIGISWQLVCLLIGLTPVLLSHLSAWSALGVYAMVLAGSAPNSNALALTAAQGSASAPRDDAARLWQAGDAAATPLLLYVLLSGLVASRLGLWVFDLAVLQLQQQLVPAHELGTVSGVQASLQSFFGILSFVAGAIINKPEQFHWLMIGSVVAVTVAAVLFFMYVMGHARPPYRSRLCSVGAH